MEIRILEQVQGNTLVQWLSLLARTGLTPERDAGQTVLVYDGDTLAATGSRTGNILKYIAVDPAYQGQDLTATVLTALRQEAFRAGFSQLFLYTKPQNEYLFRPLFFYPVAKTQDVLLMESEPQGIRRFLEGLDRQEMTGNVGALVMNCDPFTLGHRYLIETAAKECAHVYVFVLSEDRSHFSAAHRMAMVQAGTRDIPNVTVLPTGPYLISSATFPTYFLKERDRAETVHCDLDIAVFTKHFVPYFSITHRFVGEEPLSAMTQSYNAALARALPQAGLTLSVIPRLCKDATPISAGAVRTLLKQGQLEQVQALLPQSTFRYLCTNDLLK